MEATIAAIATPFGEGGIGVIRISGENSVRVMDMVDLREPLEIIEIDVNSAYEALGEITGEAVSDDILNEVFSRFCLGK